MKVPEEVEILLDDLDEENISSILKKWDEIVSVRKKINDLEEMLKTKIRTYLKERKWDRYMDDDTKISVTISTQKRDSIDSKQLKVMLTDAQLSQVMRTTTFEKLSIMTPESRERIKKFVKK